MLSLDGHLLVGKKKSGVEKKEKKRGPCFTGEKKKEGANGERTAIFRFHGKLSSLPFHGEGKKERGNWRRQRVGFGLGSGEEPP